MTLARISKRWAFLPIIAWAIVAGVVIAALWSAGTLRAGTDARQFYDSGTRAAMSGDLSRAALDLRRAQRVSPGLIPLADSLAVRIDANLAEVRSRVAAAQTTPLTATGESASATPAASHVRSTSSIDIGGRPTFDRIVAAVRAVPWATRVALASLLIGLLVSLVATRSFRVAAGERAWPGAMMVTGCAVLALGAAAFATVDGVIDSRRVEAVLVQPAVARAGPDDLTYPPAVAAALPAGTEVLITGESDDGRWLRISRPDSPRFGAVGESAGEAAMWLPRSVVERVDSGGRHSIIAR